MEELALPQCLGHAVGEVQACHLLVADFRVQAHHLAVLERFDEGHGVTDGGQEHVATGLIGLGFERGSGGRRGRWR